MRARATSFESRDVMQLVVFSLIVVVGPLLVYPRTFGVDITVTWPSLLLVEIAYYLIANSLLNAGSGLGAAAVGAIVSFCYRMLLSVLIGLMIFAPGAAELGPAIGEGVYKYWPAFALFIICSPFVTASLVRSTIDRLSTNQTTPIEQITTPAANQSAPTLAGVAPVGQVIGAPGATQTYPETGADESSTVADSSGDISQSAGRREGHEFAFGEAAEEQNLLQLNGFERGVRYLAEDGSVRVAAVIDPDGLTLATFGRMGFDPHVWAPLALTMMDVNADIFSRHGMTRPTQLETLYQNMKIDCRAVGPFLLMVVAERHADDLLGVRISQTTDMIEKYVSSRYDTKALARLEGTDVRNTQ